MVSALACYIWIFGLNWVTPVNIIALVVSVLSPQYVVNVKLAIDGLTLLVVSVPSPQYEIVELPTDGLMLLNIAFCGARGNVLLCRTETLIGVCTFRCICRHR